MGLRPRPRDAVIIEMNAASEALRLYDDYGAPYSGGYMEHPYNWLWAIECARRARALAEWDRRAAEREPDEGGAGGGGDPGQSGHDEWDIPSFDNTDYSAIAYTQPM